MVGDWMGSIYGSGGKRHEIRLFMNHDGRYEWTEWSEPESTRQELGRWSVDDDEKALTLQPDSAENHGRTRRWRVLSVTTCEDSNVLLVLREIILASRNLPILFYCVHCDGRGYGSA